MQQNEDTVKRFEGKVALITGAARGIGQATAVRFASEGAGVAICDINAEGLKETADQVTNTGQQALVLECDVRSEESVQQTVEKAVGHFDHLDVLCNIAGVLHTTHTHDHTLEDWNRVIAVNLTGTFLMCRAAIPHLLKTKGNIVNTASTAALGAHPFMAGYAASKGGVLSMTRTIALEYSKQGLRANAVCPGGIETPMMGEFNVEGADMTLMQGAMPPHGRYGRPEQVAATIAFIASKDGGYLNGEDIRIDGGALS